MSTNDSAEGRVCAHFGYNSYRRMCEDCGEYDSEIIAAFRAENERLKADLRDVGAINDGHVETITDLRGEVAEVRAQLEKVQKAAMMGMAAAKAQSGAQLREASRLASESKPELLASERSANELLTAEIDALRAQLEQARVQLAGCGVAALGNTPDSAATRAKQGDYGWSDSYAEVCRAVDREIELRAQLEDLKRTAELDRPWATEVEQLTAQLDAARVELDEWRYAAQFVGEHMSSTGPKGYYQMTPNEWTTWALGTIDAARTEDRADE